MADEQIKIRIQADAEQFKAVSAAVERALADIGKQAEITQGKIKGAGDAVKKSNQQWTNLALVIQDLPFGFRGIQNNLPALVGGIAGATGAIYLAFSSVVAITTAYEKEIVQLIYGITELDRATQSMNKSVANNVGEAKAQIAVDQSLLSIITNVNKSTKERETALTQLKSQYEGNIELQKTDIKDGAKLVEIINKISAALIRKAKAQAFAELIAKQEAKILELQSQAGEEVIKNLGFMKTAYSFLKGGMDGFNASSMVALDAFGEQGTKIKNTTDFLKVLNKALNANTEEQIANNDAATLDDTKPGKPKTGKTDAQKEAERMVAAEKYLADWQIKLNNDIAEAQRKELERQQKLQEDARKQEITDYTEKVDLFKSFYANKLQLAAGDRDAQKAILEQQMQDLVYFYETFGMYAGDVADVFSDIYKKWVDNNKAIADEAMKSIINIGIGIMNALGPSLDMLLEKGYSIGQVLSQVITDLIKKFVKLAIAAAVAVAIIAIINPAILKNAGGALKFAGNLVGQGMGLGANLFGSGAGATATGTAQGVSNNIIPASGGGSGAGTVVLRGQDLVLALNRSETSLKYRQG
jgi:hypothetical protein